MKLVFFIYYHLRGRMSQPPRVDGRVWIAGALALYFVGLWLANFVIPYADLWKRVGVPSQTPIFGDLRAVLVGFECTRQGFDVLYSMPCDPNGAGSLAYPRLWMALARTGLGLNHAIVIGVLCALSLYAVVLTLAERLNKYEAVVYVLVLCSPAAMLLVERGNVDILMFDLLFLALVVIGSKQPLIRFFGYLLILVPSVLKLLPIFAVGAVLKEKQRWRAIGAGLAVLTIFVVYCIVIREEIKVFKSFYGYAIYYSSGVRILPHEVRDRTMALFATGLGSSTWKNVALLVITMAFAIIFVKLVVGQLRQLNNWFNSSEGTGAESSEGRAAASRLDAFRVGSCVYLGTFLSTIVFDYKLIFLIFTIPQLLCWIKHDRRQGPSASAALVGIVAMFYAGPFLYKWLVDEMINWGVAAYLVYALLITLPAWAKAWAKNSLSASRAWARRRSKPAEAQEPVSR